MLKFLKSTAPVSRFSRTRFFALLSLFLFSITIFRCSIDDNTTNPVYQNNSVVIEESSFLLSETVLNKSIAAGEMLPQQGNPVNTALDGYKGLFSITKGDAKKFGDLVAFYQYPNGGWIKQGFKETGRGYASGIIDQAKKDELHNKDWLTPTGYTLILDNGSTITEFATLGYTYREYGDATHKAAAQKTMELLLKCQQPSGGWQQYNPARSQAYSKHATFNDELMMRVLISLQKAVLKQDPFNSDIFTEDQLTRAKAAIAKGVDYILKAQIKENGKLTVWCAQHNMQTYAPEGGREYELPSKSGQESALIIAFLMSQPQTPEIAAAVKGALEWYNSPDTYIKDMKYVRPSKGANRSIKVFVEAPGEKMWFRFYELGTNKYFFCDKGTGGKKIYGMENYGQLSDDRYGGYVWANDWPKEVLAYAAKVGLISSSGTGVRVPLR